MKRTLSEAEHRIRSARGKRAWQVRSGRASARKARLEGFPALVKARTVFMRNVYRRRVERLLFQLKAMGVPRSLILEFLDRLE